MNERIADQEEVESVRTQEKKTLTRMGMVRETAVGTAVGNVGGEEGTRQVGRGVELQGELLAMKACEQEDQQEGEKVRKRLVNEKVKDNQIKTKKTKR
ncbi:hypothetical protein FACS189472_09460 [Alphaproteobacteria bacterium]|nr:hypothetical protein FACS189472_09460 [Alphaproteobacteria bacterium]